MTPRHSTTWLTSLKIVSGALLISAMLGLSLGCESQPKSSFQSPEPLEDDFDRAADRPPTADTLFRFARLLAAEGKDAECEQLLQQSVERFPSFMPMYNELAELYIRQRKLDAAVATLNKGLMIMPNDAVTLNNLGMTYMLKQNYGQALHAFTRANAADRDNARYVANMAMASGMMGNYDESLALYQQVLTVGQSHFNVAVIAEARNDMERANQEYALANQSDPNLIRKSDRYDGGLQQRPAR
jgi:tetratricopeptide (TPR) repeat protein